MVCLQDYREAGASCSHGSTARELSLSGESLADDGSVMRSDPNIGFCNFSGASDLALRMLGKHELPKDFVSGQLYRGKEVAHLQIQFVYERSAFLVYRSFQTGDVVPS